ncbi:MAG: hypothetical protein RR478_03875, partial [Bacilli bacterium]
MAKGIEKILYKKESIDLKEFILLDSKKQSEKIESTLKEIYEDTLVVSKKHVEKVLNICFDARDNEIFLPYNLKVSKNGSKLIFDFVEKNNKGLFLVFIFTMLFAGIAATYSGIHYLNSLKLNIDLDGDGVADINIDLDGDGMCDINCDENDDKLPDKNIDYKGNRKPIFNVVREDGTITNKTNQDINGDGVCDVNCITGTDGYPNLNIDYNGDGKVDLDIDTNGDKIKDINLDTNGDGVCDINCDDNDDGKCDRNCINITISDNGNGGSSSSGDGGLDFSTASLIIIFASENTINAENIFPDDQTNQGVNTKIPDLVFTVENTTDEIIYYDMKWLVKENTFETDNFWYKVTSDNNGYLQDWTTTPKKDILIKSKVAVAAKTKQTYK